MNILTNFERNLKQGQISLILNYSNRMIDILRYEEGCKIASNNLEDLYSRIEKINAHLHTIKKALESSDISSHFTYSIFNAVNELKTDIQTSQRNLKHEIDSCKRATDSYTQFLKETIPFALTSDVDFANWNWHGFYPVDGILSGNEIPRHWLTGLKFLCWFSKNLEKRIYIKDFVTSSDYLEFMKFDQLTPNDDKFPENISTYEYQKRLEEETKKIKEARKYDSIDGEDFVKLDFKDIWGYEQYSSDFSNLYDGLEYLENFFSNSDDFQFGIYS